MKKTAMILGMVLITTFVNAQGQRPQRGERPTPEQMIEKATEELNLTEEQVKQWKEIHKKFEDSKKDHETRKQMGAELEATLTEEQLEKFREMRPRKRRKDDN